MTKVLQTDIVVQQDLASRGINAQTGVFGEHKVQFGQEEPINIDTIKTPSLPFAGFRTVTKIARGKEGIARSADDLLHTLTARAGQLDAGKILSALKAGQTHFERLNNLGQLTKEQLDDTMWMFTKGVEKLSNADLACVYQSFSSAEMDLLQTALQREGQINPDAKDARMAASRLFDLQALVLKEVSNRSAVGILEDQRAKNPMDNDLINVAAPESLSDRWGNTETGPKPKDLLDTALCEHEWQVFFKKSVQEEEVALPVHRHDISGANLLTLVEVSAQSATNREQKTAEQMQRLHNRNIQGVSVKEMADVLRSSELTYNLRPEVLLQNILTHPDEPISNIFHLAEKGIDLKGDGYKTERDVTEKVLFPELAGHKARGDERPLYGALNITQRPLGAVRDDAYGYAAIVFKPQVSKRCTFIADDTFYSPRFAITSERKKTFYARLESWQLPTALVQALGQDGSPERVAFEQWLQVLQNQPNHTISVFKSVPESLRELLAGEDNLSYFNALMVDCFGDKEGTRTQMATFDNLESLVLNMNDFNGNALAKAALEKKSGAAGRVTLVGAQYIEAQIQGPVVPSHDIAEIRLRLEDLPEDPIEHDAARRTLEEFGRKNGVKITLLENYDSTATSVSISDVLQSEGQFNAEHLDRTALQQLERDYLDNFQAHVTAHLARSKNPSTLPIALNGEALRQAKEAFAQNLATSLAAPSITVEDPSVLVASAFSKALVHIRLDTMVSVCNKLDTLPFENAAQKAAFANWICGSTSLQDTKTVLTLHTQAMAQAKLFRELAMANPPLAPKEILKRMSSITAQTRAVVDEANKRYPHIDVDVLTKNVAYVTQILLQNGEPALNTNGLNQVFTALNNTELRKLIGQVSLVAENPEIVKTGASVQLRDVANGLVQASHQLSAYLNQTYELPSPLQNIAMMPKTVRDVVREIAPKAGAKLDELFPAYVPFPKPNRPTALPTNEQQRRQFLLKTLATYQAREEKLNEFTHGRGHITRAYIFANVMCSILEESGVTVDRNAVLLGITGHDLGREGGGRDRWEVMSATMTNEAIRNAFGQDAMGEEYEHGISNSIQHQRQTVEGMLLDSADSLDIGRTADFDEVHFPFLADLDPTTKPNDFAKYTVSSTKVQELRRQLMKEAKLLEEITDPYSRWKNAIHHLSAEAYNEDGEPNFVIQEQWQEVKRNVIQEYKDEWSQDADTFVQNVENIVLNNQDVFPLLAKYYKKD